MSELLCKLKILVFLLPLFFLSSVSLGEDNTVYSGPGDNKDGYDTNKYITNSLSLEERKGKKSDLIQYVTL